MSRVAAPLHPITWWKMQQENKFNNKTHFCPCLRLPSNKRMSYCIEHKKLRYVSSTYNSTFNCIFAKEFFLQLSPRICKSQKKKKKEKKICFDFSIYMERSDYFEPISIFFFFTRISYYQYWKWNKIRKKFDRVESFSRLVSIGKWVLIYFSCRYDENTFNKYFFLIFNLKKKKHKKNRNKNVYLCLLLLF